MDESRSQHLSLYFAGIWLLYLVLSPVYVLPKGMPQPADYLLLAGIIPGVALFFLKSTGRVHPAYIAGFLFVALSVLVNLTNYAFIGGERFLLSALYYPYNFLVFCYVVYLFRKDMPRAMYLTALGITLAVVMQYIWAGFVEHGGRRMTGGFDNPNQLAYWALLCAGMLVFLRRHGRFSGLDMLVLGLLGAIQTLALSKAGIICSSVLFVYLFLTPQVPRKAKTVMGALAVGLLSYAALNWTQVQSVLENFDVIARLASIGAEGDDSLLGRGYNRLWEHPEFLLFGAGEGGFERFRTLGSSNELHAGLATIIFSYGILGAALFALFLFYIFARQPKYVWVILGCVLLFSLTHQAFRFTHFWVFLGIAFATFNYAPKGRAPPASAGPQ